MDLQPKTEPVSPPPGFSSSSHKNLEEMSISELVSVLRTASRVEDFDRVEKVLVARDARLKAEIEMERLLRIQVEEELKKKEGECHKRKRAQESQVTLLKEMKKNGVHDDKDIIIEELSYKNREMEEAIKDLKNAIDELRAESHRLTQKKRRGEALVGSEDRKFRELNECVLGTGKRQRIKSAPAWAQDFYSYDFYS